MASGSAATGRANAGARVIDANVNAPSSQRIQRSVPSTGGI
jgi:hypothetical protein